MYKDTRISLLACGCKEIELGGTAYQLDDSVAVSRGGSCLVYHATRKDPEKASRDRKVILKEFYPFHKDSGNWRKEDGRLVFPADEEIAGKKKQFEHSYDRFTQLCNTGLDNNTVKPELFVNAGDSVYMVVAYSSGITLDAYMRECDLFAFFAAMRNLAGVLGALHGKGYIHMDVKPSNILCLATNPEHPEYRELTRLLDTDSFVSKEDFSEQIAGNGLSGTPGYSAPEVIELSEDPEDFLLKEEFRKNGERADVYSFGAVIHEYIFGGELPGAPYEDRLEECLQRKSGYIPYKAISLIRKLLNKTLAKSPYDRYESMAEIETEISGILKLIDTGKVRILDNCHRNSDRILGREQKVLELREKLTRNKDRGRVVIVTGIGGIGKSSLARAYAAVYAQDYDIKAEVSASGAMEAVQRLQILNDPTEDIQNQNELFAKRKEVITNLCQAQRTLLIVNDYDMSSDPDFGVWFELGCDVILTSRNDWEETDDTPVIELKSSDLGEETARDIFYGYYLRHVKTQEEQVQLRQELDKEADELAQLLARIDHHPLAIKLMAGYMAPIRGRKVLPSRMLRDSGIFGESSPVHISVEKDKNRWKTNAHGHLSNLFRKTLEELLKKAYPGGESEKDLQTLRYMTLIPSAYGISRNRFEKWTGLESAYLDHMVEMGWVEYHSRKQDLLDDGACPGIYTMPAIIQEFVLNGDSIGYKTQENQPFLEALLETSELRLPHRNQRFALYEQREKCAQAFRNERTRVYISVLQSAAAVNAYLMDNYVPVRHRSIPYWEKAVELCGDYPEERALKLQCCTGLLFSLCMLGEMEKGVRYFTEIPDVLDGIQLTKLNEEDADKYLSSVLQLCTLSYYLGAFDKMAPAAFRLWCLFRKEKELNMATALLGWTFGAAQRVAGFQKAARWFLEDAIKLLGPACEEEPVAAGLFMGMCLLERGKLYAEMEQPEKALESFRKALDFADGFCEGKDFLPGMIYAEMGDLFARKGEYLSAAEYHRKAAESYYSEGMSSQDVARQVAELAVDYQSMEQTREKAQTVWEFLRHFYSLRSDETLPEQTPDIVLRAMEKRAETSLKNGETVVGITTLVERAALYKRIYGDTDGLKREYRKLAKVYKRYRFPLQSLKYMRLAKKRSK